MFLISSITPTIFNQLYESASNYLKFQEEIKDYPKSNSYMGMIEKRLEKILANFVKKK